MYTWYAILIWHLQRFSLSSTHRSNPLKWMPQGEEKGPQVNQGNTVTSDAGNLRGDKTHCRQRADVWSLCTQDPDPCGWAETHTTPGTWAHTSRLQGDTTSPDPAPGPTTLGEDMVSLMLGPLRWKQVGSCNFLGCQKELQGRSPLPTLVPEKSSSLPFGSVWY